MNAEGLLVMAAMTRHSAYAPYSHYKVGAALLTEKGKIVLQEIFHLLKRTNKFIVCEGVETKDMVDFLVQEGCDELQGYYYYKPMEMNKFEALIA